MMGSKNTVVEIPHRGGRKELILISNNNTVATKKQVTPTIIINFKAFNLIYGYNKFEFGYKFRV